MSTRVTLDSTILNNTPRGWDKATIKSKRDKVINGLFTEYTTDLEFWGDGFDYIDSVIDDGYCNVVDVIIETDDCDPGNFVVEFSGVIPITQISEVDVDKKELKAKIVDEGFNARISNNKKLKAIVDTGKSKNGFDIDVVTPVEIDFYDPAEDFNDYTYTGRNCYRVFDCFKFIIDHITDGEVGFVSDLFDVGGECYNLMIITGFELRQGSGNGEAPDISFEELFKEVSKKKNLAFGIEPGGSFGFNVRVEEDGFFRSQTEAFLLQNVRDIKMGFNLEKMYSSVALGSQQYELSTSLSFPPVRLKGFREETFNIQGLCNIDNELNLISEWIVDSNTIEDVLTNNEDAYDDKIFIVETDGSNALKFDTFNQVRSSGSTTADAANKLIDSGADFVTDGVTAGDKAINQTTGATAEVTSIDLPTHLSIDTDIFTANPEDYLILAPPFTYNDGLSNYASVLNWLGAIPNSIVKYFGSGDDNFRASKTTVTQYLVFVASTDPIIYDDDSTPPNFDTNGNYSNGSGRYIIPSDGLYGFRTFNWFEIMGTLGADLIVNGGFSADTDWNKSQCGISPPLWEISGGVASIDSWCNPPPVIHQNQSIVAGARYILTFEITDLSFGAVHVATFESVNTFGVTTGAIIHGTFNTVGTHTVQIERSSSGSIVGFIAQREYDQANFVYRVELSIDNVTMKALPRYRITNKITRYNSSLQQLQVFSNIQDVGVDFGELSKFIPIQTDTGAFGAFKDDIIRASLTIADLTGTGVEVNFGLGPLSGQESYFQTTVVEDGGGELVGVDVSDFVAYTYKFEKPLAIDEFRNIVDNPEYGIVFNRGTNPNENILGWREDIEYDKQDGKIKCNLVSKQKITVCQ